MSDKTSTLSDANVLAIKMGTIFSIGFVSLMLIRAGYKMGANQSRKMLRKCNKEYHRIERWEKKILKEQKKREKEKLGSKSDKRWKLVL